MVGHDIAPPPARAARTRGAVVLELIDVHARRQPPLSGVNLAVHGGEIVAIAGVAGNGQRALAELLFGEARPAGGALRLNGRAYPASPRAAVAAGIARVPEDRRTQGSVGDLSVWENAAIEQLRAPAFARAGVLKRAAMRAFARRLVGEFGVRGAAFEAPVRQLSGGNLQKLILGRALSTPRTGPRLIVADQPTWGLDVGAVADIHARLIAARDAGDAVLLISEDLDEIFALADRIAVINGGRIAETRATADWTLAALGLAMAERRAA
jgi:simple sugar transport system ATP-binding protein